MFGTQKEATASIREDHYTQLQDHGIASMDIHVPCNKVDCAVAIFQTDVHDDFRNRPSAPRTLLPKLRWHPMMSLSDRVIFKSSSQSVWGGTATIMPLLPSRLLVTPSPETTHAYQSPPSADITQQRVPLQRASPANAEQTPVLSPQPWVHLTGV